MTEYKTIEIEGYGPIQVPADASDEEVKGIIHEILPSAQGPTGFSGAGFVEPALAVGSGAVTTPLSGISGLVTSINTMNPRIGADVVERTQEMGYTPKTQKGQEGLQYVNDTVNSALKLFGLQDAGKRLGGRVLEETGSPAFAAMTEGAVSVAPDVAAFGVTGKVNRIASREIEGDAKDIVQAGKETGVPVLRSDVDPPTSFMGNFTRQLSEKMGFMGTGGARQVQQIAREQLVEDLASGFGASLDSEFFGQIINNLDTQTTRRLQAATNQRTGAVNKLIEFGNVPVNRIVSTIDRQLAKQSRLGEKANTVLVNNLEKYKSALLQENMDFSVLKELRTEIIEDINSLGGLEGGAAGGSRTAGTYQSIKSSMDKAMMDFARKHDRAAAADWLRSNRMFAEELTNVRRTELNRILKKGEATPENVLSLLRGGRRSELGRLHASLSESGRAAVRSAIVQDALNRSGLFATGPNPNRVATELSRPNAQQAIDIFFKGDQKKAFNGMIKLLNATRRAQDSMAVPSTGVQALPFLGGGGLAYGMTQAPFTTAGAVVSLAAFARAYESPAVRNLMLKINSKTPGELSKNGQLIEAGTVALVEAVRSAQGDGKEEGSDA